MFALKAIVICTVLAGCFGGTRDDAAAARWITAPTAEECERRNLDMLRSLVEEAGDQMVRAVVKCERVGV